MTDSRSIELRESVRHYLDAQIREHLVQRAEYVKESDVRAAIAHLRSGSSSAKMTAELSGTINGTPIRIRTRAQRNSAYRVGGAVGGGVLGGAVGGLAVAALHSGVQAATRAAEGNKYVVGCAEDICSSLLIEIDRRLNVPRSALEMRWFKLRNVRWIATLVLLAAVVIVMVPRMDWGKAPPPLGSRLFIVTLTWLIPAGCFFIVAYCASILAMPSEFYDTPRGRRVMAISGVKSTRSLRALCAVFIVGLSAGMSTLIWYFATIPK
jgi:hypothetical protein